MLIGPAVAVLAAIGLFLQVGAPASAAVVPDAITGVTTTIATGGTVTNHLTWCVPDTSKPGDTFSLTLPDQLGFFDPSFPLDDSSGDVVANASITSTPPDVATFTLTNYIATHSHVCGTAMFTSYFNSKKYAGTTQTLTYVTSSGQTYTTTVTVPPLPVVNRTGGAKTGHFTNPLDQCRTDATDCIQWNLQSPIGPFTSGTMTDQVAAGQTIDCTTVPPVMEIGTDGGRAGAFSGGQPYSSPHLKITCAAGSITATYGAVPATSMLQLSFDVSVAAPGGAGGVNYANTDASVTTVMPDGTVVVNKVQDNITSATASGNGSGVTTTTTSTSTSTTSTTVAPTTTSTTSPHGLGSGSGTTTTSTTVATAPGALAAGDSTSTTVPTEPASGLAFTGFDMERVLGGGLLLLAAGGGTVLIFRRRARSADGS